MTSVLVIDDHPIVLQGCRRMLQDSGVERIFEAPTPSPATSSTAAIGPELVIVDLAMQAAGSAACR